MSKTVTAIPTAINIVKGNTIHIGSTNAVSCIGVGVMLMGVELGTGVFIGVGVMLLGVELGIGVFIGVGWFGSEGFVVRFGVWVGTGVV